MARVAGGYARGSDGAALGGVSTAMRRSRVRFEAPSDAGVEVTGGEGNPCWGGTVRIREWMHRDTGDYVGTARAAGMAIQYAELEPSDAAWRCCHECEQTTCDCADYRLYVYLAITSSCWSCKTTAWVELTVTGRLLASLLRGRTGRW